MFAMLTRHDASNQDTWFADAWANHVSNTVTASV
jgi:hypothetical protein